jgi:chromosome partitioning protein
VQLLMAYVVSVSNIKGGVAKTSTAISLGGSLAKTGYRVLLIDLDTQADLSLSLNIKPSSDSLSAKELFIPGLLNTTPFQRFIAKTTYSNLDIIPSNGEIAWVDPGFSSYRGFDNALKEAFASAQDLPYDFILIDCPPAMDTYTISALMASDLLIIPTQAEFFSSNSVSKMKSVVQVIHEKGNLSLEYRVLVTMLDLRNRVQRQVFDDFRKEFNGQLFKTPIDIDTKIRESQTLKTPIVYSFPASRGAIQYQNLSNEIVWQLSESGQKELRLPSQGQSDIPTSPVGKPVAVKPIYSFCPYFGLKDDMSTALAYPSEVNCCYRAKPKAVPKMEHQSIHCLTQKYVSCVMLRENMDMPLLAELQEPPPKKLPFWQRLGF